MSPPLKHAKCTGLDWSWLVEFESPPPKMKLFSPVPFLHNLLGHSLKGSRGGGVMCQRFNVLFPDLSDTEFEMEEGRLEATWR